MAGKKTFVAGEVLTAQDVNDYLMDQSVMTFASSAARSSAIPTPSEGMVSYQTDTDAIEAYDGTDWVTRVSTSVPFAMAAGKSTFNMVAVASAAVTITFPASRFSVAPVVTFSVYRVTSASAEVYAMRMNTLTSSGVQLVLVTRSAGAITETVEFNWTAIQMTSTTAAG
jgi:hypothetical protein